MVYTDYDYYFNNYKGLVPENSFNSLAIRASRIIDQNINTSLTDEKVNDLSEEAQAVLKDTTCALIDLLYRKDESKNIKLSSYSIDGVTKNFNILSEKDYKDQKKEILDCLPIELTHYL